MMTASSLQQQQSLMCSIFSTWEILLTCFKILTIMHSPSFAAMTMGHHVLLYNVHQHV